MRHTANTQINPYFQCIFNEADTPHSSQHWGLATPRAHVTG